MPEIIQTYLDKVKSWWTNFNSKQKTILISVLGIIIVALGILAFVMSKPNLVTLITSQDATQAASVKDLLDENNITYQLSQDGLTFYVEAADEANASILLGSNDIPTQGYSIDNVFDGSFSTTESDKNKKYQLYLEEKFAEELKSISNVEQASVSLSIPENDGTIISQDQETYASVILHLSSDMTEDQAFGIAKFIATEVGNDSTDNVLIIDSNGNVLFSGGDSDTNAGIANSRLSIESKAENLVRSDVKNVMLGTNIYDNVEVGLNLAMSFDTEEYTDHRYYVEDGLSQGYLDSETTYESETTNGTGGVPGTDSNNDTTTYVVEDADNSSSTVSEVTRDYLPNEELTQRTTPAGEIDLTTSSISVVATTYVVYDEVTLSADGTLGDQTFDQFVAANGERVKTTVDEELFTMVSNATGVPEANITIIAYDVPFFKYASTTSANVMDYLQIVLAVLIFALLGFVVFRSMRRTEERVTEPEVSLEALLESTKETTGINREDIDFAEKSETRVLIEKFVEENPDAAASLLRNWLQDEWD
ncbi:MAG: flagellar M-ring protein FliF C-terminal domain-containing protein [Lachnospiraceae bacterium]